MFCKHSSSSSSNVRLFSRYSISAKGNPSGFRFSSRRLTERVLPLNRSVNTHSFSARASICAAAAEVAGYFRTVCFPSFSRISVRMLRCSALSLEKRLYTISVMGPVITRNELLYCPNSPSRMSMSNTFFSSNSSIRSRSKFRRLLDNSPTFGRYRSEYSVVINL